MNLNPKAPQPIDDPQSAASVRLTGAKTRLERNVQKWVNERATDYDDGAAGVLKDLLYGGCASGMVSHLIYYSDSVKFFQTHRREISELLAEQVQSTGLQPIQLFNRSDANGWNGDDPLAQETHNRNLLAWFGFERTADILAMRNDIEI